MTAPLNGTTPQQEHETMMRSLCLSCAALLAMVAGQAKGGSYSTIGTPYISIGADSSPGVIFTINPDLTVSTSVTGQGPYDGSDDSYVAVVNDASVGVLSLALTGNGIFGFDGDGIQTFVSLPAGPTGYEGPGTSFSVTDLNDGSVSFTDAGGLPGGEYAIFSLEGPPNALGITTPPVITPSTPEPSTLVVWSALGAIGLVGNKWRKRRSA
jgi:hypothetical protein